MSNSPENVVLVLTAFADAEVTRADDSDGDE